MASSKRLLFLLGLLIGYVFLISSKVAATHHQPRVSQEMDKKRGSDRRYGYYRGFDKGVGVSFRRLHLIPKCLTWSRGYGCGHPPPTK
ncbi:hypothetical protein ACS0TY_017366 [Phlomoides rotata]